MYISGTPESEILNGTVGNDHLDGGGGDDLLLGGAGDDYYGVDSSGDTVFELAGQGSDIVAASVDFTLGSNVENLYLSGNAIRGTGNNGNNFLAANQALGSELNGPFTTLVTVTCSTTKMEPQAASVMVVNLPH
jgi:Ca2+-binding RTX toxin-like protein